MEIKRIADILTVIDKSIIIIGACAGIWVIRQYRKQKRSEAAAKLLGIFEESINDIIEISDTPDNLQYNHIDDNLMVLLKRQTTEDLPLPEKPPRMIKNIIRKLKKESYLLSAQISGKEAISAKMLIKETEKYCRMLSSAIYAKLKNNEDHLQCEVISEPLKNFHLDLQDYLRTMETLLLPIIECSSFSTKVKAWLNSNLYDILIFGFYILIVSLFSLLE